MKIIDDPQEPQQIMVVRNRIAAENIVNLVDGEDDILTHAFSAETSGRLIGVHNDHVSLFKQLLAKFIHADR